ncbi:MAG: hypothetical protein IIA49_17405 [Bacteroidetes bacterium]|nr:hypothetical protein [Bacteroidota bacterium]
MKTLILITIVPAVLLQIVIWYRFNKLKKQTNALYRFCQLRRDMMKYLRDEYKNIEKPEYKEIKLSLQYVNQTIHYFHDLKITLFNFKTFIRILTSIAENTDKAEAKKLEVKSESAKKFSHQYARSSFLAFIELVPFLKWKLGIHLTILLSQILVLIGIDSVKKLMQWFEINANKPFALSEVPVEEPMLT